MCATEFTTLYQTQEQAAITVDSEASSDYESGVLESETTSLRSSVWNFQYENGRRYHRLDDKSLMPNDEREQDRLDLQHHLFYLLLGGELTLAPLRHPVHRILDVGTGTGIWALDVAATYPEADVRGIDITPIQPAWTLSNCTFEVDDAERDWTYAPGSFDFIHSRELGMSIKDWPRYLSQIYRATKPGGYIELVENHMEITSDDGSLHKDCMLSKCFFTLRDALHKIGVPGPNFQLNELLELVRGAGFTEIRPYLKKQPFGPWPADKEMKKLGRVAMAVAQEGLYSYALAPLTRVLEMNREEVQSLIDGAWKDITNKSIHSYNLV